MTAVKAECNNGRKHDEGDFGRHGAWSGVNEHLPLHSMGSSSSSSTSRLNPSRDEKTNSRTLAVAKTQFASAVADGVSELMKRCGYSRQRATALLMREIRTDDEPPADDEVFRVMKLYGIGLDDASKTLTVARALQRTRLERGLSAVEAIDNLTSRLSASRLLGRDVPVTSIVCDSRKEMETVDCPVVELNQDEVSRVATLRHVTRTASAASRKNHPVKSNSKNSKQKVSSKGVPPVHKTSGSSKVSGRKRSLAGKDDDSRVSDTDETNNLTLKSKPGHNSEHVDAEIVTKAKMSQEDGNRSPTPTVVRSKRSVAHRGEDQQLQAHQPPIKRPRAGSEV